MWDCPVHCRMCNKSLVSTYYMAIASHPQLQQGKNVSRYCQMSLGRQSQPRLRTTAFKWILKLDFFHLNLTWSSATLKKYKRCWSVIRGEEWGKFLKRSCGEGKAALESAREKAGWVGEGMKKKSEAQGLQGDWLACLRNFASGQPALPLAFCLKLPWSCRSLMNNKIVQPLFLSCNC